MPQNFIGTALPLSEEGMSEVIDKLKVSIAELWAVLNVETRSCGFLADRRPTILFERHVFSRETNHKFDVSNSDISNPQSGKYGSGGAHQYDRLNSAIKLDRIAALCSTSWGIGQLMGFNAKIAGYTDVQEMVTAMMASEDQQLLGMAGEIIHNNLDRALQRHNWAAFARGYNGPAYAKNDYDTRLAAAYQKYALGPLPDLLIRSAQIYLTYLEYHPGPADGIMGRFTRSALNDFQGEHNLPLTDVIDDSVILTLKKEVDKLPIRLVGA
ncbi:MAG: DUF3380 domain-containing protein [Deltaproteobacteria bacterium]|nr:DUF3380 domain-containing protein [Deltaproteobacteria bacterium]